LLQLMTGMSITRVLNQTRGNVVCERTEVAGNPFTRMRGLLGRAGLDQGAGMLFRGESSIHSAFMRFEFDAIFMDRDLRVVKVAERIKPWRALGAKGSANILELAGGEISRLGIAVGDQLAVSDEAQTPDAAGHG
jgi:uncharacterized membrane protein (UPF0127 family)